MTNHSTTRVQNGAAASAQHFLTIITIIIIIIIIAVVVIIIVIMRPLSAAIALGAFALSSAQTTTHPTLAAQTFGTDYGGLRKNFLSVANEGGAFEFTDMGGKYETRHAHR